MSVEFRSPNLSARNAEGQIQQLLSFLRQHVQQLNWVLKNLETGEGTALTETKVTELVSRSPEVFQTILRKLKKKQAQENFLGAKKAILENGAWSQGSKVTAELEAVSRYTLFLAVTGDVPVACARQGSVIHGQGVTLTCGETDITVTEAENPVTALYAVI